MYLCVNEHGGNCCGILHLYDFEDCSDTKALEELREGEGYEALFDHPRLLIEVVLTDQQIKHMPKTVRELKKRGFVLVSRIKNPNSGNFINVLHRRGKYTAKQAANLLVNSPYLKED